MKQTPLRHKSKQASSYSDLDKMARLICLSRGSCVMEDGTCSGVLEWAHIRSRRFIDTRWLEENCLCLCSRHHRLLTDNGSLMEELVGSDRLRFLDSFKRDVLLESDWVKSERARLKRVIETIDI